MIEFFQAFGEWLAYVFLLCAIITPPYQIFVYIMRRLDSMEERERMQESKRFLPGYIIFNYSGDVIEEIQASRPWRDSSMVIQRIKIRLQYWANKRKYHWKSPVQKRRPLHFLRLLKIRLQYWANKRKYQWNPPH